MSTTTPSKPDPAEPRTTDPTIGRLVADASANLSGMIRNEIALAKAEISVDVSKGVKGGAMFAVAGVFAFLGLIFLLHTIALGIATVLPMWAAYLLVTVVLFVLAAILAFVGKGVVSKIKGKPARTIDSAKSSVDAVKRSTAGDRTRAVRVADPISHGATDDGRSVPVASAQRTATPTTGGIAKSDDAGSVRSATAAATTSTPGSGSTRTAS